MFTILVLVFWRYEQSIPDCCMICTGSTGIQQKYSVQNYSVSNKVDVTPYNTRIHINMRCECGSAGVDGRTISR